MPKYIDDISKKMIKYVHESDMKSLNEIVDSEKLNFIDDPKALAIIKLLSQGTIVDLKAANYNMDYFKSFKEKTTTINHLAEYEFIAAGISFIAKILIIETKDNSNQMSINKVAGFHLNDIDMLKKMNAFTLKNKSFLHFFSLFIIFIFFALVVYSLYLVIYYYDFKKKWFWIFLLLNIITVGRLYLNWTTGKVDFQLLNFGLHLPFFSLAVYGMYEPWILLIHFPIAPIFIIINRFKKDKPGEGLPDPNSSFNKKLNEVFPGPKYKK